MISAFTSPTFSWRSLVHSCCPPMIASRASLTHSGQSESVWRGHPKVGLVFCQDFNNGFSVHFGVNGSDGLNRLKYWTVSNATPAAEQIAASTYFVRRLPRGALAWLRTV